MSKSNDTTNDNIIAQHGRSGHPLQTGSHSTPCKHRKVYKHTTNSNILQYLLLLCILFAAANFYMNEVYSILSGACCVWCRLNKMHCYGILQVYCAIPSLLPLSVNKTNE